MVRRSRRSRVLSAVVALVAPVRSGFVLGRRQVGRGSDDECGACPTTPVDVVVSVDQWGDIVSELGGDCARVKTLLASSSVDPHDYEPTPADAATFEGAQLVVVNGAHYDEWAAKLAATLGPGRDGASSRRPTDARRGRIRTSGTTRPR